MASGKVRFVLAFCLALAQTPKTIARTQSPRIPAPSPTVAQMNYTDLLAEAEKKKKKKKKRKKKGKRKKAAVATRVSTGLYFIPLGLGLYLNNDEVLLTSIYATLQLGFGYLGYSKWQDSVKKHDEAQKYIDKRAEENKALDAEDKTAHNAETDTKVKDYDKQISDLVVSANMFFILAAASYGSSIAHGFMLGGTTTKVVKKRRKRKKRSQSGVEVNALPWATVEPTLRYGITPTIWHTNREIRTGWLAQLSLDF